MIKQIYFKQFNLALFICLHTVYSSIWSIDMTLPGTTTLSQSGPKSDGNEGVLQILQSSSIIGTLLSDCSVS